MRDWAREADTCEDADSLYNMLQEAAKEIERLQAIIDKHLHERKCQDCSEVFYTKDSIIAVPYCVCPKCGPRKQFEQAFFFIPSRTDTP